MKRRSYILIIILIFFFLIVATLTSFVFFEFRKAPTVRTRSYLEINLSGNIYEKAESDFFTTLFGIRPPLSLYDVWRNIQKAKSSKKEDS